jgi:hypothetical protein
MRYNSKTLPPHIAAMMPDQQRLDLEIKLPAELQAKIEAQDEAVLHNHIENLLRLRGAYWVHSRMDKKTANRKGVPDFIVCYQGVFVGIEAKVGGNKPTDEQMEQLEAIMEAGGHGALVYSLDEVIALLNRIDETKKGEDK